METVCQEDRHSLMRITDFNGRVVIAKKYIKAVEDEMVQ